MEFDRMILGEGIDYTIDSNITQLNNNVAVVGGSGSGKSMSYSEPRILELHHSNMIMKVSKRKLIDKYTPLLKARGYNVGVLDLSSPKGSTVAFDPLYYVKSEEDVTHIAESLVYLDIKKGNINSKADPYWDQSAVNLICSIIYIVLALDGSNGTLSTVIQYIKDLKINDIGSTISTNLDNIFDSIEKSRPDHPALSYWRSFSQLPPKTARCVYSSLIVSFNSVFTNEIMEMMNNENKIDFEKIAEEKTVLFVLTSAVSPALHSFANLFFSYAIKELFEIAEKQESGVLPIPIHLLSDDFAVGGKILNFEDYIAIFREKGISVSLLLQSESQLSAMYGEVSATTILNNCDTYVYLGGMDLVTCEHISKRVNLPLDEILYMPIGQEIIFRRGQKPIITQRYNITHNELYRQITCGDFKLNKRKNLLTQKSKMNKETSFIISLSDELKNKQISSKENESAEEKLIKDLEIRLSQFFEDE